MFVPKKMKGGSYIHPITKSGLQPTAQDLFGQDTIDNLIVSFNESVSNQSTLEALSSFQDVQNSLPSSFTDDVSTGSILAENIIFLKDIKDYKSTQEGYINIITLLSQQSAALYTAYHATNNNWNTATNTYKTDSENYSTLSSIYTESVDDYNAAASRYNAFVAIEQLSIAQFTSQFSGLYLITWVEQNGDFGYEWVENTNSNQHGGQASPMPYNSGDSYIDTLTFDSSMSLEDILTNYSNRILDTNATRYSTIEDYYSQQISTYSSYVQNDSKTVSTIISTIYGPHYSTLSTLSSQLLIAEYNDWLSSQMILSTTSTYNHYYELYLSAASTFEDYSTSCVIAANNLKHQSDLYSTIKELYDFQVLQSSIIIQESHMASTYMMKSELEELLQLKNTGQDFNNYYSSFMIDFPGVNVTPDTFTNLLDTVNILYSQYSTTVASLIAQEYDIYGMTPDEVAALVGGGYGVELQAGGDNRVTSYIKQKGFENQINDYQASISSYNKSYTDILPSKKKIHDLLSTQIGVYSTIYNSTLTDDEIIEQYRNDIQNYSTVLNGMYQDASSTLQEYYKLETSLNQMRSLKSVQDGIISEAIRDLILLGGKYIPPTQSGGATTTVTYDAVTIYAAEALLLKSGGGVLGGLNDDYDSIGNTISTISTLLLNIKTGNLTLGMSTQTDLMSYMGAQAYLYGAASIVANNMITPQQTSEIQSYINALSYLSCSLLENIMIDVLNIEIDTYIPDITQTLSTSTVNIPDSQLQEQNIMKIQPLMDAILPFITILQAEQLAKNNYITLKQEYETQSYYKVISAGPPTYNDVISSYEFEQLSMNYDLTIQTVNGYIANRQTYYNAFNNSINSAISQRIFDPAIYIDMTSTIHTAKDSQGNIVTLNKILPLKMSFDKVPQRTAIFSHDFLPPVVGIHCPPEPNSALSLVQTLPLFSTPTTTLDTVIHGIRGQYIRIQKQDNNIEIQQILVIDSTGKNVAFGAAVGSSNISDVSKLSNIVNGNYAENSPPDLSFVSRPNNETTSYGLMKSILIDLGLVYDICTIQYLKNTASTYNSQGFIIQILQDLTTPIGNPITTIGGTSEETFDIRPGTHTTPHISLNNARHGICGYLARYVRIRSSSGTLQISQIAIVSSNGINLAQGVTATYGSRMGTPIAIPLITDGNYHSRDASSCFIKTAIPTGYYVEIDLGREMDVTAVQIYNTSAGISYQKGTTIDLYTEDNQLAIEKTLITDNMKEIIDFRFKGSDSSCPIEIEWPSYYGVAGIIARYVGLQRTDNLALGFSKLQLIDKSGRDVGLFKPTIVTSTPQYGYLGVTNYIQSEPSAVSYVSATGSPNQRFIVDLQQEYEICAINILACSDAPNLLDNTVVNFYKDSTFVDILFTRQVVLNGLSSFFDTRYDPEDSIYPVEINKDTVIYGLFGTLGFSVSIPGNPSTIQITEGAGFNICDHANIVRGISTTTITFNESYNLSEVNSVVIYDPSANSMIGTFITLYGCYGEIVNYQPIQTYLDNSANYVLADFRNPLKSSYAPMDPLPYTSYNDICGNPLYHNIVATYNTINSDIGYPNIPALGILTRYVKVVPRDTQTPLYISQIIVVDSNGINVAFEKDTFTPKSSLINTTGYAVDGSFARGLDNPNFSILALEHYISRPPNESFVSLAGNQESNYWVVDLGREYLINSIIYVSSKRQYDSSRGVIVELYDAQLQRVGVKLVSQYVSLFGVDILDFRIDRTVSAIKPGAWLELCPQVIQWGTSNCGILGQYIRITNTVVNTPIVFSQLIVTDAAGNNIALYKPTYSSTNSDLAYKIVDGAYYQRKPIYAYTSNPDGNGQDYIEVNLGKELEIVNLYFISAINTPYTTINIYIYNKSRYIIGSFIINQSPQYSNIPVTTETFVSYPDNTSPIYVNAATGGTFPLPVIGINILKQLSPFTTTAGLILPSVIPPPTATITLQQTVSAPVCVAAPTFNNLINNNMRGSNGGITGRYIHVYNINKYIQISQIMVYGFDGQNYAYHAACSCDDVFPGTYVAKVTDGEGGYFHSPRPCDDCFKSSGKTYDFLEVDLGNSYEIIGVRCIFASDNQGENIGAQIQVLDSAGAALAQHVVGVSEIQECIFDCRMPPASPSIQHIIMPIINSLKNSPTDLSGPNGLAEGPDGILYVVDTLKHCIWSMAKNTSTVSNTPFFGTAGTLGNDLSHLSSPIGLAIDGSGTYLYVSDYGNQRILKIVVATAQASLFISMLNPYGLYYYNNIVYCTSYDIDGSIYCFTIDAVGTVGSTTIQPHIQHPNSIIVTSTYYYVSSAQNGIVYRASKGSPEFSAYIGNTGSTTVTLPLKSISGITYDICENIIFIADHVQDKIYAVTLSSPTASYSLAGTGNGGFSGDGFQSSLATMDGPICILYSPIKGYLYISDYNNHKIRYLQLYSTPPSLVTTTMESPSWPAWATETHPTITFNMPTVTYTPAIQFPQLTQITSPATISTVSPYSATIASFYISSTGEFLYGDGDQKHVYITSSDETTSQFGGRPICIIENDNIIYILVMVYSGNPVFMYSDTTISEYPLTADVVGATWIGFDNNGVFYISDATQNCIRRQHSISGLEVWVGQAGITPTATYTWPNYGTQIAISSPGPFVFDTNNNLIFIDTNTNTIYKVTSENRIMPICPSTSGTPFIDTFYKQSDFPKPAANITIRGAAGITIDPSDSLYITSSLGQQIIKLMLNASGNYQATIISGFGSNLLGGKSNSDKNALYAVLLNPSIIQYYNGNLYFMDSAYNSYDYDTGTGYALRMITPEDVNSMNKNTILPYGPLSYIVNNTKNTYNTTNPSGSDEKTGIIDAIYTTSICCSTTGIIYFVNKLKGTLVSLDTDNNITQLISNYSDTDILHTTDVTITIYNDSVLYISYMIDSTSYIDAITLNPVINYTNVVNYDIQIYNLVVNPIGYLFYSYEKHIGIINIQLPDITIDPVNINVDSINALAVDTDNNLYVATNISIVKYLITYTSDGLSVAAAPITIQSIAAVGLAFYNGNLYFSYNHLVSYIPVLPSIGTTPVNVVGYLNITAPPVDGTYSNTTSLNKPTSISIDSNGNLFILDMTADLNNPTYIILRNATYTELQRGLIYTIAGKNSPRTELGYQANMLAYLATFTSIKGICYDSQGQIYISDAGTHSISMIDINGIITTFAGTIGTSGLPAIGNGGAPTSSTLNRPQDIKMSKSNVLYIADTGNNCIRRITIYGAGLHINTFGGTFASPTCLAIDSNENIYVVSNTASTSTASTSTASTSIISIINQTGNVTTPYSIPAYRIESIAINSSNTVYFTGNNSVYMISAAATFTQVLTGLSNPRGLCFDASDNLYISDTGNNLVYCIQKSAIPTTSTPITPNFIVVGNGLSEYSTFATDTYIAQNIYGTGKPPTENAISFPGALAFDPVKGLLIAQSTKITLYNLIGSSSSTSCGTNSTTITITNTSNNSLYLSQVVALNNNGMNALLGGDKSYVDGFYGSKSTDTAYTITGESSEVIQVHTNIVCILLYISANKSDWNTATITLSDAIGTQLDTRTIKDVDNTVQYITLDYRRKTPACLSFNNYINKYKLQDSATTITTAYRQKFVRYIRIIPTHDSVQLSNIAIIHAETGVDIGMNSSLSAYIGATVSSYTTAPNVYIGAGYYVSDAQKPNGIAYPSWIEFDLHDEYPIDQIILYSNNLNISYIITGYTNTRDVVYSPTSYTISNPSVLDSLVAYVRIQGSGAAPIVLQSIPTVDGGTVSAVSTYSGSASSTTGANIYYTSTGSTNTEFIEFTLSAPSNITNIVINSTLSTVITTSNEGPAYKPHQLIFYNSKRNEIFRTGITFSSYTIPYTPPAILSYSFMPTAGTGRVRFIHYNFNNTSTNIPPQITAIDINGINVMKAAVSHTGYWQADLGQEYELLQINYVNVGATPTDPSGYKISLLDSFGVQIKQITATDTSNSEVYDCRNSGNYLPLRYSISASNDSIFIGATRGRYVRFEIPFSGINMGISNLQIYDIYNKNISTGKITLIPVTSSPPNTTAGSYGMFSQPSESSYNPYYISRTTSYWCEIDLGQQYSIKTINAIVSNSNRSISEMSYAIYNSYRGEVFRSFFTSTQYSDTTPILTSLTVPFTVAPNISITNAGATAAPIRFIRISKDSGTTITFNLIHLAIIDARGMDIGVWKPVRQVDSSGNIIYTTNDSTYSKTTTIYNIWEIDLGSSYNIDSLVCYGSGNSVVTGSGFSINTYNSQGSRVGVSRQIINTTTREVFPIQPSGHNSVQNTIGAQYGTKTRYITLKFTATGANFQYIAVIDSLGRNIAYNKTISTGTGSPQYSFTNFATPVSNITTNSIQIDLQEEYYISFIIIYYKPPTGITAISPPVFDTTCTAAIISLIDSLWNTTGSRTLAGATYNYLYPIDNIFNSSANSVLANILITLSYTYYMVDNVPHLYPNISGIALADNSVTSIYIISNNSLYHFINNSIIGTILSTATTTILCLVKYNDTILIAGHNTDNNLYLGSYASTGVTAISITVNGSITGSIQKIIIVSTTIYFLIGSSVYRNSILQSYSLTTPIIILPATSSTTSSLPRSMGIDSLNNIYISSLNIVYKYSLVNDIYTINTIFGSSMSTSSSSVQFNTPSAIAIDSNNYVFVADTGANRIRVITPSGAVNTLALPGTVTLSFTTTANSLAIDSLNNLYIGDSSNKIYKITVSSVPIDLPFIGPYSSTSQVGTYPISSSSGIQIQNSNLAGTSYAEILDFSSHS